MIFWDAKRPITAKLLNSLDLAALARKLGRWTPTHARLAARQIAQYSKRAQQTALFAH